MPLYSLCDERYCHIKIGTNWCLFIRTVMRDTVISKSAPIGADLDLTISLRCTVRMNKEAPIGADSFCDNERYCQIKIGTNWCLFSLSNERYCQIKIGTNWCLFIWTVMRDSVISKSAPIGADLDLTISLFIPSWYDNALRNTEWIKRHQLVPLHLNCNIQTGTNWCRSWSDNIS